jgi:hypothetical protein
MAQNLNMWNLANACGGDVRAYCAGIPQGGGRIAQCLREHGTQISETCRNAIASSVQEICGADIARFCTNVKPGEGKVQDCLRANAAQLAPSCQKAALNQAQ